MNETFSKKYKQTLLLRHFVSAVAGFVVFLLCYFIVEIAFADYFYIILEWALGYDFAYFIHSYEPAVILFVLATSQFLIWIAVESHSSRKMMKIIDSLDDVLDYSTEEIVLPAEFSDLQNRLNLLKAQNREQQHFIELEAQKKSDTLTYLAHDIRTPLASVIGYLSLVCEAPDMPPEQRNKFIRTAFEKALKFEKLIDEFFDITRYSLSDKAFVKKQVDLSFLIEQIANEFYPLLRKKGLHFHLDIPDHLVVLADAEKVARVFNNVIKNAVAYSYPQSVIEVTAEKSSERITVMIKNHGETIPPNHLERIFDKFYRTNPSGDSDLSGAGLGLAIAKEIMRLHNGTITAESMNEMTIFTLALPLDKSN
ncbi:sensor histidine kinase [Shouchella tritolerans]|uniref:sensor histidine kinase n=1 Tax=Shouchella tritolerans TaxID=2979466 RepID=UPI0021E7750D|nr:HAMP domain-containing sensor histidine kinase [Shouchella tritolerans]